MQEIGGFCGGKGGDGWGMLDSLETKQIHGSDLTKLHQTNKSQKNWGYFWWGIFEIGKNTTKLG